MCLFYSPRRFTVELGNTHNQPNMALNDKHCLQLSRGNVKMLPTAVEYHNFTACCLYKTLLFHLIYANIYTSDFGEFECREAELYKCRTCNLTEPRKGNEPRIHRDWKGEGPKPEQPHIGFYSPSFTVPKIHHWLPMLHIKQYRSTSQKSDSTTGFAISKMFATVRDLAEL